VGLDPAWHSCGFATDVFASMTVPRPLTVQERGIVLALLPVGFADADVYRAQIDHTSVTETCSCGCPSRWAQ
jgi:hypothetical protein